MEGSDLRAPLSVRGRREPQPSRHIAVERVAERVGEVQRDEPRPPQRLRLSRSPEEAGRRSTASCNSRQSARWRRSAPSRSAADFRALAVCWFIPTSSRLAGEHDDLPAVRGLVVAKYIDGTVVRADLEVTVVGAVPAIDDLEHLDAAAAQFEPAWALLAPVAGVAVDVDVHGAQRATGMGLSLAKTRSASARSHGWLDRRVRIVVFSDWSGCSTGVPMQARWLVADGLAAER